MTWWAWLLVAVAVVAGVACWRIAARYLVDDLAIGEPSGGDVLLACLFAVIFAPLVPFTLLGVRFIRLVEAHRDFALAVIGEPRDKRRRRKARELERQIEERHRELERLDTVIAQAEDRAGRLEGAALDRIGGGA